MAFTSVHLEVIHSLINAVEKVMNPLATNEERQIAHKICEEFKETSKQSFQYGLHLAEKNNSSFVRHFGLQVVEHFIKYRWQEASPADKSDLKINVFKLVDQGTKDILEEEQHIKDGVSRILVELMKREWPQLWENLFTDFTVLCRNGETQTELVLLTLLRLTEDVVRFQNLPHARRRELLQALTSAMSSISSFFMFTLNAHLDKYKSKTGIEAEKSCKICLCVLDTLTAFVDWINITHIIEANLLPRLSSLLLDKNLCLRASECLLLIVGRKGKISERKPIMVLFSQEAMTVLLQAANNATEHITESTNYIFLKRLCEILLEIGKQLCYLWGSSEDTGQPPNFEMYLKALLAFTQHPSQSLRQMIYTMWLIFLRHPIASKDPVFQSVLPMLIQCGTVCLHKVGFPSHSNSVSCDYSRLEFDTDEEFNAVLSCLRVSVVESIRTLTLMVPKLTFSVASAWLTELLNKPIDIGTGADADRGICNLSSPSFISWDACSVFLEAVMSKLFVGDGDKSFVQEGIDLLHKALAYQMQDPLILSAVLSCLSGLFPFLNYTPQTLPQVLEKIFGAVVFNLPGQTKSTRSQAVKNVRVHACSVLVKICKNYPGLLLPEFRHLYDSVKQLDSDREQLSQMEKIILIEALIIVSNQFHDFARQAAFIEEVIAPVKELWSSEDFNKAFSSPEYFMDYVGLNKAAVEPSSADTCGINRSHITYCINTILAVIKRSQWPEDYNVAQRGGFIIGGEGCSVLRNPATPYISPLLNNLMTLLKTTCSLFKPEYLHLRHIDFVRAYDLTEHDKLNILGIPPVSVDNSDSLVYRHPLERMQIFISTVFDYGFHILGNASQCLGAEFYCVPGLSKVIIENLIVNFKLLPDFRAKTFIRNFIKPFIQCCPKGQCSTVVLPVLYILTSDILQRLSERWLIINKRVEEEAQSEEQSDPESQEILEEHVVRQLTREYLELLVLVLTGKSVNSDVKEEMAMEDGDVGKQTGSNPPFKELSELGVMVVGTKELFPSIIMCIINGFSWADTTVCHRCTQMLWPVVKQIVANNDMSEEAASHIFVAILTGLQLHGEHESTQSCLLTLSFFYYETLRQKFPSLTQVLHKIPDVNVNLIKNLEVELSSRTGQEKKKKDCFKKIVSSIIGRSVSDRFRRSVQYSNLPQLFLSTRRPKTIQLDEVESENMGLL
ncbi:exportin-5-like isoform X2 [Biomphalaria glabrata]|uniref:Exportin-5-like isoform X2 n=1 Tax=Biomphalaria glabrata TaxID=6526 RepID=A0A9W2ZU66_BIOGL|nr:exportin-5-like isoform X2 [Biomphalaria glabrata]